MSAVHAGKGEEGGFDMIGLIRSGIRFVLVVDAGFEVQILIVITARGYASRWWPIRPQGLFSLVIRSPVTLTS